MKELLSRIAGNMVPAIETNLRRRALLGGLVCSAAFSSGGMLAQAAKPAREKITAANGVSRTLLEQQELANGEEFRLVLTELPPGLTVPGHYHPVPALGYVLEGVAETRYEDDPEVIRLAAGQTFVDKANVMHSMFRNPDANAPLKFLVAFTIKKGEEFFKAKQPNADRPAAVQGVQGRWAARKHPLRSSARNGTFDRKVRPNVLIPKPPTANSRERRWRRRGSTAISIRPLAGRVPRCCLISTITGRSRW